MIIKSKEANHPSGGRIKEVIITDEVPTEEYIRANYFFDPEWKTTQLENGDFRTEIFTYVD